MNCTVKLKDKFASRSLMKSIDVLGDNGFELALRFKLGEFYMSLVREDIVQSQFVVIELVEFLGILLKEAFAENLLGGIFVFLAVKPVDTAKIGNSAFGGNASTSKKDDVAAVFNHFPKLRDFFVHVNASMPLLQNTIFD